MTTPTWTLQRVRDGVPTNTTGPLNADDAAAVLVVVMLGSDEPVTLTATPLNKETRNA